jgi:8-oxo-dGTP pyrophosphatase MutT (NUDIX family)
MRRTIKRFIKFFRPIYWPFVKAYYLYLSPETRGVRIVLTYKGEILFVKNSYGLKYNFPGGNIGKNENAEFGAKREVKEELGIDLKSLIFLGNIVPPLEYEYRKNTISIFTSELINKDIHINNVEIETYKWLLVTNPPSMGHTANQIFEFYCSSTSSS